MKVFITIDTEYWGACGDRHEDAGRTLYGVTRDGDFGLLYQLRQFDRFRIKANYFVEPLFTLQEGDALLKEIVHLILSHGQDVQLHLHTEWLEGLEPPFLPSGATGRDIRQFSRQEQAALIRFGKRKLLEVGVPAIDAFRAGNYGGNLDTLAALRENGIRYDTTHNACYMQSACDIRPDGRLLQPRMLNGVIEFPVTWFRDMTGRGRHLQLAACSIQEIRHVLNQAWAQDWYAVVIVMHSFELVKWKSVRCGVPARQDRAMSHRFVALCRFLQEHRDRFETATFSALDAEAVPLGRCVRPLSSNIFRTAGRMLQQGYRRVAY